MHWRKIRGSIVRKYRKSKILDYSLVKAENILVTLSSSFGFNSTIFFRINLY